MSGVFTAVQMTSTNGEYYVGCRVWSHNLLREWRLCPLCCGGHVPTCTWRPSLPLPSFRRLLVTAALPFRMFNNSAPKIQ